MHLYSINFEYTENIPEFSHLWINIYIVCNCTLFVYLTYIFFFDKFAPLRKMRIAIEWKWMFSSLSRIGFDQLMMFYECPSSNDIKANVRIEDNGWVEGCSSYKCNGYPKFKKKSIFNIWLIGSWSPQRVKLKVFPKYCKITSQCMQCR